MLKHIPFYASLLGRPMQSGKTSTVSHVLVYGAIEAHSLGSKGCIASNKLLAEETGLTKGTVNNVVSLLRKSGWISYKLDKNNQRGVIKPLLIIGLPPVAQLTPPSLPDEPPFTPEVTPLHSQMNIEDSLEDNREYNRESGDSTIIDSPTKENKIAAAYYDLVKDNKLPVTNHNNLRRKIKALEDELGEEDGLKYLQHVKTFLEEPDEEYKPSIVESLDVYSKRLQVIKWLEKQDLLDTVSRHIDVHSIDESKYI